MQIMVVFSILEVYYNYDYARVMNVTVLQSWYPFHHPKHLLLTELVACTAACFSWWSTGKINVYVIIIMSCLTHLDCSFKSLLLLADLQTGPVITW